MAEYVIVDLLRDDIRIRKPIPCTCEGWDGYFIASAGPFLQFAQGTTEWQAMDRLVMKVGQSYQKQLHTLPLMSDPWWEAADRAARNRHMEYIVDHKPGWKRAMSND